MRRHEKETRNRQIRPPLAATAFRLPRMRSATGYAEMEAQEDRARTHQDGVVLSVQGYAGSDSGGRTFGMER